MLAATVTLTLFAVVVAATAEVLWHDGRKILAALEGRSWAAEGSYGQPVTIRFSRPGKVAEPAPMLPALRAAA